MHQGSPEWIVPFAQIFLLIKRKPAILKPIPGALRRVVGSPNLRLLPLLCDHAALAEKVIPRLPMIVAPSVGTLYVISCSLQVGSGAGCMSASYLSFIPPDAGNHTVPQDR